MLYQQYLSGKSLNRGSNLLITLGSIVIVPGIIFCIVGEAERGHSDENYFTPGIALTVAGVACISAGIPMKRNANKKINNSLDTYRRIYYSTQSTPHLQFNMYGNGMGLAYVF